MNSNYMSVDKQSAISSYGDHFEVGQTVSHEDKKAGTAKILSFSFDENSNKVLVNTDKGYSHIDFIVKID